MSSSEGSRLEPLYVLYGSQMGNSEGAAQDFCRKLPQKFTAEFLASHNLPSAKVQPTCIQLDDFLELKHAAFTKCVVIFVSSYGVGQAPLGAYRFREVCDLLAEDSNCKNALKGLKFAICGLGDSNYTTKFKNPTCIDAGLRAAGATRIGDLAKADANGMGEDAQDKAIEKWMDSIWLPLAKEICSEEEVDTKTMQANMIPLLVKLDPDYIPPKDLAGGSRDSKGLVSKTVGLLGLSVLGIAVAMFATTKLNN